MKKWTDWTAYHHTLTVRYYLIVAIILLPFTYFYLEAQKTEYPPLNPHTGWLFLGAVAFTVPFWWAIRVNRSSLASVDTSLSILDRLTWYYQLQIRDYLRLSVSALIATIGFGLTEHTLFVVAYVLVLVMLSIRRPYDDKAIRDLKFNEKEREVIRERLPFPK